MTWHGETKRHKEAAEVRRLKLKKEDNVKLKVDKIISRCLKKIKQESDLLTTSDLQGTATIMARDILVASGREVNMARDVFLLNEIENPLLNYAYGETDLISTKKEIQKTLNLKKKKR